MSITIVQRLLLAVGMLLVMGCATIKSDRFVGKEAPYARVTMFDGSVRLLDSYRGKPLLLLFWATNCQYSNPVVESLNELARKYRGRGVQFLAVSLDSPAAYDTLVRRVKGEKLSALQHGFSGNEGLDELFLSFEGDSLPILVVIDAQGTVVSMSRDTGPAESYLKTLYR